MRAVYLLALIPLLLGSDLNRPASPVGSDCLSYAKTHTLVRDDVLAQLQADRSNFESCEPALKQAQTDLGGAKAQLIQAEKDLKALHQAALEQRAVIAELKAQKAVLEAHITKLEGMTCPEPTVGDQIAQGWEEVDGTAGLGAGYALGTGMCVALAWVFNQPAFNQ